VARLVRRSDVIYDVLVVIASVLYLILLCVIGSDLAKKTVLFSGLSLGAGAAGFYWTAWGAALEARLIGQFFAGWILGRFLRRFNPWYVAAGILLCFGAVAVWLLAFPSPTTAYYVSVIGYRGYTSQVIANVLVAWGAIVGAIWMGRRGQRVGDATRTATARGSRIVSPMYATFNVGESEVHEVGVLCTISGRQICTVDGEKALDVRSLALRGSRRLTIGDAERHEITIRWRTFPMWSVEALVDGELCTEGLFPDLRLFLKSLLTVAVALIALLLVAILLLLSVMA